MHVNIDLGKPDRVTVEEYLDSLAEGIDLLELRRLESCGIPTDLSLECMAIQEKVVQGTATPEEIVRGLMILTPSLRPQLMHPDSAPCCPRNKHG